MNIVVLDGYTLNPGDNPWDAVGHLGELTVHDRTPHDKILERARDADIVFTNKTPLTAATMEELPKLRFICVLATGYNVVDMAAARKRGIPVSNVPVYGTDSVAQYVFALLLALCHRVEKHDAAIRSGEWARRGDFCFWDSPLIELAGMTIGIVGFGRIGRRVGEIAHAMGMNVLAADVFRSDTPTYQPFAWRDVDPLFAEADVVSLHSPQTKENTGFVNKALISKMKATAFLINTARGGLVNERDLAEALNNGRLGGAALDVVSREPIEPDNPVLHARNCLLTPHMAWGTLAGRKRLMAATVDNLKAFLAGKPINVVN